MILCKYGKIKHSLSSKRWLSNHFKDQYVRKAQKTLVRSRAWFKLDQIHSIDSLFSSGMNVIDLGSAPGGWSEYVREKIGQDGRVISCDILSMNKITGVDFIQGDFCDFHILQELIFRTKLKKVDVILSDMCPNITGIANIDIPKVISLGEKALDLCKFVLIFGGSFLVKVFQGDGFDEYLSSIRSSFNFVKIRKPHASHIHSREMYVVAKEYKI